MNNSKLQPVESKYSNSLFFRALSDDLSSNHTLNVLSSSTPAAIAWVRMDIEWARLRLHTVLLSNGPVRQAEPRSLQGGLRTGYVANFHLRPFAV